LNENKKSKLKIKTVMGSDELYRYQYVYMSIRY